MIVPSSLPSSYKNDGNQSTNTLFASLLLSPKENISFITASLHWFAILSRWFLNLLLILLGIGVVLGVGYLIFGSFVPVGFLSRMRMCGDGGFKNDEVAATADRGLPPSTELVELGLMISGDGLEGCGVLSDSDDDDDDDNDEI